MKERRRLEDWHHMLVLALVMAILGSALAFVFLHWDPIPNPASAERVLIDDFVRILFAIAGVVFAIVISILGYSLLFFRRSKGDDTDARSFRGNKYLELTWTIVPLIIVVVLSIHGVTVLNEVSAVPAEYNAVQSIYSLGVVVPGKAPTANSTGNDLVVNVDASRFIWEFSYPQYSINSTYVLEVPVNRRLILNIASKDVVHSFWVQQWGPKQDAVPGLSPTLSITPTVTGNYSVECSQLCGFGHTNMTAPVRVVSANEFDSWIQQQGTSANATSPPAGSQAMFDLTAQNIAFDKSTITVPAGVKVMIMFDNKDNGVPHNFSVYKTSAAADAIFVGKIITGPGRIDYTFMAPQTKGTYFFRCDVHPTLMTGTFIVK